MSRRRVVLAVLAALMLVAWGDDDPPPDPGYEQCVKECRSEDHVHCERDCKEERAGGSSGGCGAMIGSYADDCDCSGEVKPACASECSATTTTASASRSSCAIAW